MLTLLSVCPPSRLSAQTVPCESRSIVALMDCQSRTAMLSWSITEGAVSYAAVATTASGHAVRCETNHTNCELGGLFCGQSYSVTVRAHGETCNSLATMTGQLVTGEKKKKKTSDLKVMKVSQLVLKLRNNTSLGVSGVFVYLLAASPVANKHTVCSLHMIFS